VERSAEKTWKGEGTPAAASLSVWKPDAGLILKERKKETQKPRHPETKEERNLEAS